MFSDVTDCLIVVGAQQVRKSTLKTCTKLGVVPNALVERDDGAATGQQSACYRALQGTALRRVPRRSHGWAFCKFPFEDRGDAQN